MKKKLLSIILTAVLVFSLVVPSLSVAALNGEAIPKTQYRYVSDKVYGDVNYWYPNIDAYNQFNSSKPIYERAPTRAFTEDRFCYFDSENGTYVDKSQAYRLDVYEVKLRESKPTGRVYTAYLAGNGLYYPTESLALANTDTNKKDVSSVSKRGTGIYFALNTGSFYDTYAAALTATNGRPTYIMLEHDGKYYDYRYTPLYRNSATGKYYLSYQEAADANIKGKITYSATLTQGYYFNRATGHFYMTRDDAKKASRLVDVIAATSLPYSNGVYSAGEGDVPYYEDGVYNPYYTEGDNSSVKNGDAYIYNNTSIAGWNSITTYVKNRGNGTAINVNMNKQRTIPKSFLEALKDKEITVVFINENGSRFSIKGTDITTPKAIDIGMSYGTNNIPASVLKTVRTGALSSSQFTLGDYSSYGLTGKITVAFNKERAGKKVNLYYFNPQTGKAVFIDSATIEDNGRASFRVTRSGDYVAVIMK
jgi:hypothetical protein